MPNIDPDHSWAILIGVSQFPEDPEHLPPLPAVSNNLDGLFSALVAPDIIGLRPEHVVRILDQRGSVIATKLVDEADKAEDTLIVYYAGHGLVGGTTLYLVAADTTERRVEFNGIDFAKFREAIMRSPARRKVLILDCCYSGRAAELMGPNRSLMQAQIEDVAGTYVLASSAGNLPSVAPLSAKYTAFTGELLELLNRGIDNQQSTITLRELYQHLRLAIRKRTGLPEPQQAHSALVGELIFARNRQARRAVEAREPGGDEVLQETASVQETGPGHTFEGEDGRSQGAGTASHDRTRKNARWGTIGASVAALLLIVYLALDQYENLTTQPSPLPKGAQEEQAASARTYPELLTSREQPDRELVAALSDTSWRATGFEVWEDKLNSSPFWEQHFWNAKQQFRNVDLSIDLTSSGDIVVKDNSGNEMINRGWRVVGRDRVVMKLNEGFDAEFVIDGERKTMHSPDREKVVIRRHGPMR